MTDELLAFRDGFLTRDLIRDVRRVAALYPDDPHLTHLRRLVNALLDECAEAEAALNSGQEVSMAGRRQHSVGAAAPTPPLAREVS